MNSAVPGGLRVVSAFGERRMVAPGPPRRAFGVPPSGPFDRLSAALANALIGQPESAPVLEIALGPIVLQATEPLNVAVVGGPDGLFPVVQGERLEVLPIGARAYVVAERSRAPTESAARILADPPRLGAAPIRVVPGPQAGLLDVARFLTGTYTVGLASNRVGVRLDGIAMPHELSLPSEPAIPGAIQIPPSGVPIVLGPDGPTIGGYPKVAVVIGADLDRLGRARPGDTLRFRAVSLDEAREAARIERVERERRCAELRIGGQ